MISVYYKQDGVMKTYSTNTLDSLLGEYEQPNSEEVIQYLEELNSTGTTEESLMIVSGVDIKAEVEFFVEGYTSEGIPKSDFISHMNSFFQYGQQSQMDEFFEELKSVYESKGVPYTEEDIKAIVSDSFNTVYE